MKTRISPFAIVALALALAACSSGGPPASDAGATSPPPAESPSTAPPDEPVSGEPGNGGGGGGGGINPNPGEPKLVEPVPGQLDPHPVAIEKIDYRVEGRHVVLNVFWSSGVEPCYVLDSVVYTQDGQTIEVTVLEGHGPEDAVCIEIALQKVTIVDLGELDPGEYTVKASDGPAPPVTITVG